VEEKMGLPTSPGAYVVERDLSGRIQAVSTSIGAIVGPLKQGPINERVLVTNEEELISIFGAPDPKFTYLHYAALEFLSKSSRLFVTRVVNDDPSRDRPLTAGAVLSIDDISADLPIPRLSLFARKNWKAEYYESETDSGNYDQHLCFKFRHKRHAMHFKMSWG
jgi:hypothetical protein